jgi:hypothetical protein
MAAKINVKNSFVYLALLFCVIALVVVVSTIFKFADKGFQLSDETFYLRYSLNFNSGNFGVTNFGLLNNLFCFGHPTILNLRLAKLIYQSLAIVIFIFSLFHFLKHKGFVITTTQKVFILVIALMTSFCNYDYLPMTLSYNIWSLILTALCFSVIFIEYSSVKLSSSVITSVMYGFLCFSLFLAKLPNAVIMVFMYVVFNLFSIKRHTLVKILGALIGTGLAYFVFLNNFQDLKNIIDNYYVTLFEVKHVQANSYFTQLHDFFLFCVQKQYILFELLVVLLAVITKMLLHKYKALAASGILLVNYVFASYFFKGNSVELYNDFMAATLLIINAFLFTYLLYENRGLPLPKKEFGFIIFFLFVIPFLLMLGTDNQFYYTTSQTMVFSIVAVIIYQLYAKQLNVYFLAWQSSVICVFISCILYQGAVKTPYRQNNLLLKTFPMHFSEPIDGLYESYESFVDYTSMNVLVNEFNGNKKPVVTFFNHIGLSYLNNCKVFPETIISDGDHVMYYNEYILTRYHFDDRFDLIVVPESVENNDKFKVLFSKYGVFLKENYKLQYVYKLLSTGEKVYFYKKQV